MKQLANVPRRVFLFLQGPHGPFFHQLAIQLSKSGATTLRVGFNSGDSVFWPDKDSYFPYRGSVEDWPATFEELIVTHSATDLVLYGDTRPVHANILDMARQKGVNIHVFEEGYLRPYWITYERGGSNGHSDLMNLSISDMKWMVDQTQLDTPIPPGHWGDIRQHVFYGALYHCFVMFWNRGYPMFRAHRKLEVTQEFRLYVRRLFLMPLQALERMIATLRVRMGSFPYHLALLQLEHDSSFQAHSPFQTQCQFLESVISGFAEGAPRHHHLVFKAHPLEDGRAPVRHDIRRLAKAHGIDERVHFVRGGKLAGLLNEARSAVTVNSTAAQQALWRGIPVRALGDAVYNKPELVSDQPLALFFEEPMQPDVKSYRLFRNFLLATSQLPGSFYASRGRRQVLRLVTDMMLRKHLPFATSSPKIAAVEQHLKVVR